MAQGGFPRVEKLTSPSGRGTHVSMIDAEWLILPAAALLV
jgi:hypothetical protein